MYKTFGLQYVVHKVSQNFVQVITHAIHVIPLKSHSRAPSITQAKLFTNSWDKNKHQRELIRNCKSKKKQNLNRTDSDTNCRRRKHTKIFPI